MITNRVQATLSSEQALKLAAEYVRIHNEASKKYKAAFAAVDAKMWNQDDAHLIKPTSVEFIAKQMSQGTIKVYESFPRPLTILDSYPEVKRDAKKMKQLNTDVDAIHKAANAEWQKIRKGV